MKKIEHLFFYLILTFCISCSISNPNPQLVSEIENEIEKTNSQCPVYLGGINKVTMESATYGNNTVTYNYTMDRIIDDDIISNSLGNLKSGMLYGLKAEAEMNSNSKQFCKNIVETGGKIVARFYTSSGKSFSIEISNKELEEVLNLNLK